ncbi:hypothetical protein OKHIL_75900 [Mycolicibacterium mageritense]
MGSPDEFLNAAVDNVHAFNDATSVQQLFDRALTADEAYGILDATEILTRLMLRALVQLNIAVGQSLSVSRRDGGTVDAATAPLTAAAAHMAQTAHYISVAGENAYPLLAEALDDTGTADETHSSHAIVAAVRGWVSRSCRAHRAVLTAS